MKAAIFVVIKFLRLKNIMHLHWAPRNALTKNLTLNSRGSRCCRSYLMQTEDLIYSAIISLFEKIKEKENQRYANLVGFLKLSEPLMPTFKINKVNLVFLRRKCF